MSILLKVKAGETPNFAVKLDHFPSTAEVPQSKGRNLVFALAGLALFIMFILGLTIGLMFIAITGLLILFRHGTGGLFRPDRMTFGHSFVDVSEFGIWKPNEWKEPYTAFEGVVLYKISEKDDMAHRVNYRTIELKHPDKTRTLPLLAKKGKKEHDKKLQHYANILNLPAFD